jgi:hypothetical protein
MKFVVLLAFISMLFIESQSVDLRGRWLENDKLRVGLNEFLTVMGVNLIRRNIAINTNWQNKQTIYQQDLILKTVESRGPLATKFRTRFVADNSTETSCDLGELGGVRTMISEFKGNSLIAYVKTSSGIVDIVATRTIDPKNRNQMVFAIKHLPSGIEYISYFIRTSKN